MENNNGRYAKVITALADELGHLVSWRTNKGNAANQMYKLLKISRTSHVAYLASDNAVPEYIWNQLEMLNKMSAHNRYELAFKALVNQDNLTVKSSLELAIKGWERLVGCPFGETSGVSYAGRFSPTRANREMNVLALQDESGIGVGLLLQKYLTEIGNELGYTFAQVFYNYKSFHNELLGFTQAKMFLSESPLGDAISAFRKTCIDAIKFYKPDSEISEKLIDGAITLMVDAKSAYKRYPKFQVSSEALKSNNQDLKLQDQIYVFESISSLIEQSTLLPNGFSLNLIRTARPTDSFFCIVVKSGENIHLLTDKPDVGEFAKDAMSSRNQRYNLERYENSYMPYYFIDMSIEDNGRVINVSDSKSLVVAEDGLQVLGHFKDMDSSSILWFTFLIEEIRNDFFSGVELSLPELGFINQDTLDHKFLSAPTNTKQLPSTYVSSDSIIQKSAAELDRSNLVKGFKNGIGSTLVSKNGWMEEKYNHLIDDSVLYIPESLGGVLAIENKSTGLIALELKNETNIESRFGVNLKRLPSTLIGTKEDVQSAADQIARYNKALIISKLLNQDYKARESEVKTWIAKQIKRNLPTLVDQLVSLNHEYFFIAHKFDKYKEDGTVPVEDSLLLRQIHVTKSDLFYDYKAKKTELQEVLGMRGADDVAKCAITKYDDSNLAFYLNVTCIHDLEIVTGLSKEQFPVELQNWRSRSDLIADARSPAYDPIEDIDNPWWKMKFRFAINLDSDFVRSRRKELGIKGRFVKPKNYFEDDTMLEWLNNHPMVEGLRLTHRHTYDKPEWAFYTMG